MLMAIARNEAISNADLGPNLPVSWRTLYELSRLDPPRLRLALDRDTRRSQIRNMLRFYRRYVSERLSLTSVLSRLQSENHGSDFKCVPWVVSKLLSNLPGPPDDPIRLLQPILLIWLITADATVW